MNSRLASVLLLLLQCGAQETKKERQTWFVLFVLFACVSCDTNELLSMAFAFNRNVGLTLRAK